MIYSLDNIIDYLNHFLLLINMAIRPPIIKDATNNVGIDKDLNHYENVEGSFSSLGLVYSIASFDRVLCRLLRL
jgi:hypothetical protein